MRVLIINEVCGHTSTGKICAELAEKFEAEGHEVKIAYGRDSFVPEEYKKYAVKIGTMLDVYSAAIQSRIFDNHGLANKRATKKFLIWADQYQPDLIWLHNIHGYYINFELLFAWLKSLNNVEIKWTLHDCWAFTGHCAYFTYIGCDKWKRECNNCPQKRKYPTTFLIDNSKGNFQKKRKVFTNIQNLTVITPSNWLKNLVEDSFLGEYPIEVVPNFIDINTFKPTSSNFKKRYDVQDKIIILGVANIWDERKGLEDFLLLSDALDDSYIIVLVGKIKYKDKNLPQNIINLGVIRDKTELAKIYSAADWFLNLSYEDNYPTVILEAQACNTPVITYDVGGAAEALYRDNFVIKNIDTTKTIKEILWILYEHDKRINY